MTREQYFELKAELKELAKKIRATKDERKQNCRSFSLFEKQNGGFNDYYEGRIGETQWLAIRSDYNQLLRAQNGSIEDVETLRRGYRLRHVVYCLARGRTMAEIEPQNKEGNELSIELLKPFLKKYELSEKVA